MNIESQGQLMITRRTLFRMESKDLGLGHANVIVSSGSARARNPGGLGTGKCFPPPPAPLPHKVGIESEWSVSLKSGLDSDPYQ